jgi:hypothetical protein
MVARSRHANTMNRTTKYLLAAFLAAAALAPAGLATHQYPVKRQAILAGPAYGAVYTTPQQAHASSGGLAEEDRSRLRRIEDKLDEILRIAKEEMAVTPEKPAGGTPAPAGEDPLRTGAAKCAACHDQGVFNDKGGAFQLFVRNDDGSGDFAKLTENDRRRIVKKIESGQMPPKDTPQLTDAEKKALTDWFKTK